MPSAKSGQAGTLVSPAAPTAVEEADVAEPGEVDKIKAEQRKTKTGKYGSVQVPPHQPPQTKEEKKKKPSWIEIVLVDDDDRPVAGERFKITLSDGSVAEGTLDDKGFARVAGMEPGTCKVTFPELDKSVWKKA